MKKIFALLIVLLPTLVFSHCEIPCGIYGDELRFHALREHITTMEKSMKQIVALAEKEKLNYNQIVRWVTNKETHAREFSHIVMQYFMTQRLKPVSTEKKIDYREYLEQLELLHKMLVYSMKAKQTTNLEHIATLRSLVDDYHSIYWHAQMAKIFRKFVTGIRTKNIDILWEVSDSENKKKIGKEKMKELLQNDKACQEIEIYLTQALQKLASGLRFELHGHHASLRYSATRAVEMVFEDGKWLISDFE